MSLINFKLLAHYPQNFATYHCSICRPKILQRHWWVHQKVNIHPRNNGNWPTNPETVCLSDRRNKQMSLQRVALKIVTTTDDSPNRCLHQRKKEREREMYTVNCKIGKQYILFYTVKLTTAMNQCCTQKATTSMV